MYSLVISDDEYHVLNSLKNSINWEALQFRVVGTAADGMKALEIIKEKRPDVVLTDVVMPGMDGLELAKIVKESGIKAKFVVLSAYNEFKYAQKAISYGVKEYILKPYDDYEISRVFQKIKNELDSGIIEEIDVDNSKIGNDIGDSLIQKVKKYIRQNAREEISLQEVAGAMYVNSSYLSYAFKKETGVNFCEYVNYVRIELAKELLRVSKYRVKEISIMVGYDNYAYFCRIFKKIEGLTPLEFRACSPIEEVI